MLCTEPRTESSYKAEMAAHERWMERMRQDGEAFRAEMEALDRAEELRLREEAEADARTCSFCGRMDCKDCEREFDRGFDEAHSRSEGK